MALGHPLMCVDPNTVCDGLVSAAVLLKSTISRIKKLMKTIFIVKKSYYMLVAVTFYVWQRPIVHAPSVVREQ
jgi:hypothetical protein